jgi:hypothetical protein
MAIDARLGDALILPRPPARPLFTTPDITSSDFDAFVAAHWFSFYMCCWAEAKTREPYATEARSR